MTDYIGCIMMQDGNTVQSSIQKKVLQVFTDSSTSIFLGPNGMQTTRYCLINLDRYTLSFAISFRV